MLDKSKVNEKITKQQLKLEVLDFVKSNKQILYKYQKSFEYPVLNLNLE